MDYFSISHVNNSGMIYLEMVAGGPYAPCFKMFRHLSIWRSARVTDAKVLISAQPVLTRIHVGLRVGGGFISESHLVQGVLWD